VAKAITIIQDTREQLELDFSGFRGVKTIRKGLKTGDYSIDGYEDAICWERKSVADCIGTLTGGHERFLREMERMQSYEEKYILIEHTASVMCHYCDRHGWATKFDTAIQSLLAYAHHYHVRVRFCKNREDMANYIVRKSREFLKKKGEQNDNQKVQN
jgi:ERCC4-type nuclease